MNLLEVFARIRCFVFDVDGVLTDGSLLVLEGGQMARRMNIRDGYALQLAIKKGYDVVIISGGISEPVRERLEKLGVTEIFMNIKDKKTCLADFVLQKELSWENVLFMGDDIPDYLPMTMVGLPCCPADAAPEIKSICRYVANTIGGSGCAREVIEKVLKLNGDWEIGSDIAAK